MFYLPISVAGFAVYGRELQDTGGNILGNLGDTPWLEGAVTLLITLHVILTYIILINPVNQEFEEAIKIPKCKKSKIVSAG